MSEKTKDIIWWIVILVILVVGFSVGIMKTNKIYESYEIIENTSSTIERK